MGVKQFLRRHVGLWVVLEARNYAISGWRIPYIRLVEIRESRRLSKDIGKQLCAAVAVVIPTYRRNADLAVAIRSVLDQTFTDLCIVVVDDGGGETDDLPSDDRLTVVHLSKNSGGNLGMVRNIGMALCDSKYVAFLDDDNAWYVNHLSEAIAVLQRGEMDMLYTAVDRFNSEGFVDTLSRDFDARAIRDDDPWIDANSLVFRSAKRVRFSLLPRTKKTIPKEDWRYVFDMSLRRSIAHLAVPTVAYSINPDSYFTNWPDATR